MEFSNNNMRIDGNNNIYISRYEVVSAFFSTEEDENVDMANALNQIFNIFCEEERKARRNITELPFDMNTYKRVIDYIEKTSTC